MAAEFGAACAAMDTDEQLAVPKAPDQPGAELGEVDAILGAAPGVRAWVIALAVVAIEVTAAAWGLTVMP